MGISRIESFIHKLKQNTDLEIICKSEIDYLRANYEPSSFRSALTNYRNEVKANFPNGYKEIIKHLVLTNAERSELAHLKQKQLSSDLLKQRPVYDLDLFIDTANQLLKNPSYQYKILGLSALTGRRTAEIACTAKFEMLTNDDTRILFTGQLKTKNRTVDSFPIQVLGNPANIIKTLNEIRSLKPEFINNMEKFHNAASKEMNLKCKKAFNKISDDPLKPKDLRSIYAEICYFLNDDPTIAKQKYFSLMLGHGEDDNATGTSYLDFYIADENYI